MNKNHNYSKCLSIKPVTYCFKSRAQTTTSTGLPAFPNRITACLRHRGSVTSNHRQSGFTDTAGSTTSEAAVQIIAQQFGAVGASFVSVCVCEVPP